MSYLWTEHWSSEKKKTLTRLKIDVQRTTQWLIIALSRKGKK